MIDVCIGDGTRAIGGGAPIVLVTTVVVGAGRPCGIGVVGICTLIPEPERDRGGSLMTVLIIEGGEMSAGAGGSCGGGSWLGSMLPEPCSTRD